MFDFVMHKGINACKGVMTAPTHASILLLALVGCIVFITTHMLSVTVGCCVSCL
jgi:hypothetical protein